MVGFAIVPELLPLGFDLFEIVLHAVLYFLFLLIFSGFTCTRDARRRINSQRYKKIGEIALSSAVEYKE
jgi:hypothetical protein